MKPCFSTILILSLLAAPVSRATEYTFTSLSLYNYDNYSGYGSSTSDMKASGSSAYLYVYDYYSAGMTVNPLTFHSILANGYSWVNVSLVSYNRSVTVTGTIDLGTTGSVTLSAGQNISVSAGATSTGSWGITGYNINLTSSGGSVTVGGDISAYSTLTLSAIGNSVTHVGSADKWEATVGDVTLKGNLVTNTADLWLSSSFSAITIYGNIDAAGHALELSAYNNITLDKNYDSSGNLLNDIHSTTAKTLTMTSRYGNIEIKHETIYGDVTLSAANGSVTGFGIQGSDTGSSTVTAKHVSLVGGFIGGALTVTATGSGDDYLYIKGNQTAKSGDLVLSAANSKIEFTDNLEATGSGAAVKVDAKGDILGTTDYTSLTASLLHFASAEGNVELHGAITGQMDISAAKGTVKLTSSITKGGLSTITANGDITIKGSSSNTVCSYTGDGLSLTSNTGNITVDGGIFRAGASAGAVTLSAANGQISLYRYGPGYNSIGANTTWGYVGNTTLTANGNISLANFYGYGLNAVSSAGSIYFHGDVNAADNSATIHACTYIRANSITATTAELIADNYNVNIAGNINVKEQLNIVAATSVSASDVIMNPGSSLPSVITRGQIAAVHDTLTLTGFTGFATSLSAGKDITVSGAFKGTGVNDDTGNRISTEAGITLGSLSGNYNALYAQEDILVNGAVSGKAQNLTAEGKITIAGTLTAGAGTVLSAGNDITVSGSGTMNAEGMTLTSQYGNFVASSADLVMDQSSVMKVRSGSIQLNSLSLKGGSQVITPQLTLNGALTMEGSSRMVGNVSLGTETAHDLTVKDSTISGTVTGVRHLTLTDSDVGKVVITGQQSKVTISGGSIEGISLADGAGLSLVSITGGALYENDYLAPSASLTVSGENTQIAGDVTLQDSAELTIGSGALVSGAVTATTTTVGGSIEGSLTGTTLHLKDGAELASATLEKGTADLAADATATFSGGLTADSLTVGTDSKLTMSSLFLATKGGTLDCGGQLTVTGTVRGDVLTVSGTGARVKSGAVKATSGITLDSGTEWRILSGTSEVGALNISDNAALRLMNSASLILSEDGMRYANLHKGSPDGGVISLTADGSAYKLSNLLITTGEDVTEITDELYNSNLKLTTTETDGGAVSFYNLVTVDAASSAFFNTELAEMDYALSLLNSAELSVSATSESDNGGTLSMAYGSSLSVGTGKNTINANLELQEGSEVAFAIGAQLDLSGALTAEDGIELSRDAAWRLLAGDSTIGSLTLTDIASLHLLGSATLSITDGPSYANIDSSSTADGIISAAEDETYLKFSHLQITLNDDVDEIDDELFNCSLLFAATDEGEVSLSNKVTVNGTTSTFTNTTQATMEGTLSLSNNATLTITAPVEEDSTDAAYGTLSMAYGSTLSVGTGKNTINANLELQSGSDVAFATGAQLDVAGALTADDGIALSGDASWRLLAGDSTIGSLTLTDTASLHLLNDATLSIEDDSSYANMAPIPTAEGVISAVKDETYRRLSNLQITLNEGVNAIGDELYNSSLALAAPDELTLANKVTVDGITSTFTNTSQAEMQSTLSLSNGATLTISGTEETDGNYGLLMMADGYTLSVGAGKNTINANLELQSGSVVAFAEGAQLDVSGAVTAEDGILLVGDAAWRLLAGDSSVGSLTLADTASLHLLNSATLSITDGPSYANIDSSSTADGVISAVEEQTYLKFSNLQIKLNENVDKIDDELYNCLLLLAATDDGYVTLTNKVTVDGATSAFSDTRQATMEGTLSLSNGATLTIAAPAEEGSTDAAYGTLAMSDGSTLSVGTGTNTINANLQLQKGSGAQLAEGAQLTLGGTLTLTDDATVQMMNGATLSLASGPSYAALTDSGAISALKDNSALKLSNLQITPSKEVSQINDELYNCNMLLSTADDGYVTLANDVTVNGFTSSFTNTTQATMQGTLSLSNTAVLTVTAPVAEGKTGAAYGTLSMDDGATLSVGAGTNTINANLELQSGSEVAFAEGAQLTLGGTLTLTDDATLQLKNGATLNTADGLSYAALTDSGVISLSEDAKKLKLSNLQITLNQYSNDINDELYNCNLGFDTSVTGMGLVFFNNTVTVDGTSCSFVNTNIAEMWKGTQLNLGNNAELTVSTTSGTPTTNEELGTLILFSTSSLHIGTGKATINANLKLYDNSAVEFEDGAHLTIGGSLSLGSSASLQLLGENTLSIGSVTYANRDASSSEGGVISAAATGSALKLSETQITLNAGSYTISDELSNSNLVFNTTDAGELTLTNTVTVNGTDTSFLNTAKATMQGTLSLSGTSALTIASTSETPTSAADYGTLSMSSGSTLSVGAGKTTLNANLQLLKGSGAELAEGTQLAIGGTLSLSDDATLQLKKGAILNTTDGLSYTALTDSGAISALENSSALKLGNLKITLNQGRYEMKDELYNSSLVFVTNYNGSVTLDNNVTVDGSTTSFDRTREAQMKGTLSLSGDSELNVVWTANSCNGTLYMLKGSTLSIGAGKATINANLSLSNGSTVKFADEAHLTIGGSLSLGSSASLQLLGENTLSIGSATYANRDASSSEGGIISAAAKGSALKLSETQITLSKGSYTMADELYNSNLEFNTTNDGNVTLANNVTVDGSTTSFDCTREAKMKGTLSLSGDSELNVVWTANSGNGTLSMLSGSTLSIGSGTATINADVSLANSSTVAFAEGAHLTIGGSLSLGSSASLQLLGENTLSIGSATYANRDASSSGGGIISAAAKGSALKLSETQITLSKESYTMSDELYNCNLEFDTTDDGNVTLANDATFDGFSSTFLNTALAEMQGDLSLLNESVLTISLTAGTAPDHDGTLAMMNGSSLLIGTGGATLNANLDLRKGSTIVFAEGAQLGLGCTLTLTDGARFTIANSTPYDFTELITGVDSITYNGTTLTGEIRLRDLDNGNGTYTYTIDSTAADGIILSCGADGTLMLTPEPATTTLSLLALAALAARRRRH